ncbi:MAG: PmoA family protein [Planctomycetes bacterium]|nr:PmoA family protein [Planctomycetota bacterium]
MERLKTVTAILWLFAGLLILAVSDSAVAANSMRVTTEQNTASVYSGEQVLMRYRYRDVPYKPYADQLFTPGGVNILLDAPSDHQHHHALMFAVTADGVNFWEEHQAPGRQLHRRFCDTRIDSRKDVAFAGFSEQLDWENPQSGELLLKEQRALEVCRLTEPAVTLLTWQSRFEPPKSKESVTLTGSHYHGLGLRFIRSMDNDGEFRNADGKTGTIFRGDERLVRSRWCAYTAKADGKDVTVAMFDHPGNERHPATWFTMTKPFAYLSATLALHKEPLKVASGNPLVLRYGAALWDGRAENDVIEKLYKRWAAWPRETTATPKPQ